MKDKTTKAAKILALTKKGESLKDIAKAVKCSDAYVYYVRWADKNKDRPKAKTNKVKANKYRSEILKTIKQTKADLKLPTKLIVQPQYKDAALKLLDMKEADMVNHPPHYRTGGIETIDFIEAKDLNYRLGNVVKYITRAGRKLESDPVQDLEKALFYLKREIETRKSA